MAIGREFKAALYKGWLRAREEEEIDDLSMEVEEVIEISSD